MPYIGDDWFCGMEKECQKGRNMSYQQEKSAAKEKQIRQVIQGVFFAQVARDKTDECGHHWKRKQMKQHGLDFYSDKQEENFCLVYQRNCDSEFNR